MASTLVRIALFLAIPLASPAAAQVKCMSLPQTGAAEAAGPGKKFSIARLQAQACANSEAYKLASGSVAPEKIAEQVVDRCRSHVDEQARYGVLAEVGWTRQEILDNELKGLTEKALKAVKQTRAGTCPVTMTGSGHAATAKG